MQRIFTFLNDIEKDNKIIKSKEELNKGEIIDIQLADGKKQAEIL